MDTMNDMIIDTESFDIFSKLDDLEAVEVETDKAPAEAEAETEESDTGFDFDEIDESEGEEAEAEEETEAEEEEETESEETDEVDEEVEEEDAEEEVDYEGYEVTLPSGETIKLNEAIAGYKNAQALEAEKAAFESARTEFEDKSKDLSRFLELAKLEAEKVVEDYDGFDWGELSRTDPAKYVEHREFLDKYKARLKEIRGAFERMETEKVEKEQESIQAAARECVTILQRDIPGWGQELYGNLMDFAIENGMAEENVRSITDASTFKLLFKAYQYDKGKAVAKAKIARIGTPKKVVKSAPKAVVKKVSQKEVMAKKLAEGKATAGDLINAFDFLED